MLELAGKHILIVIENLPARFDRRVWQEATTLKENGAKVSIICPKMNGYTKSYEAIEDIEIILGKLIILVNTAEIPNPRSTPINPPTKVNITDSIKN